MITFISTKRGKLSKLSLNYSSQLTFFTVKKLIRTKQIKVNGERVNFDVDLMPNDKVEIYFNASTEKEKYSLIFSDNNVLLINKLSGYTSDEVYDQIKTKFNNAKYVHRLDRNTSGLMIFGLNEFAEKELLNGFKNHDFIKYYKAVVKGMPKQKSAVLSAYLVKDSNNSTVKIFSYNAPNSVAIKPGYDLIESDGTTSTLKVRLFTGKTHQIRAHLAFIGHPIVGDEKYGDSDFNKMFKTKRQMLTSYQLTLSFKKDSLLSYLDGKTFSLEVE